MKPIINVNNSNEYNSVDQQSKEQQLEEYIIMRTRRKFLCKEQLFDQYLESSQKKINIKYIIPFPMKNGTLKIW